MSTESWKVVVEREPLADFTFTWIKRGEQKIALMVDSMDGKITLVNARLIAAAPEMLEALKAQERQLSSMGMRIPAISNAIAKAEGKQE